MAAASVRIYAPGHSVLHLGHGAGLHLHTFPPPQQGCWHWHPLQHSTYLYDGAFATAMLGYEGTGMPPSLQAIVVSANG